MKGELYQSLITFASIATALFGFWNLKISLDQKCFGTALFLIIGVLIYFYHSIIEIRKDLKEIKEDIKEIKSTSQSKACFNSAEQENSFEGQAMPIRDDISRRLEEFEKHWNKLCKELKATGMSKDDAESWRLKFQLEKDTLMIPVTRFKLDEFNQTVDRVEDTLEVSILEARANFREKEKIRLKDAYGFFGELIYLILKIIGKL